MYQIAHAALDFPKNIFTTSQYKLEKMFTPRTRMQTLFIVSSIKQNTS